MQHVKKAATQETHTQSGQKCIKLRERYSSLLFTWQPQNLGRICPYDRGRQRFLLPFRSCRSHTCERQAVKMQNDAGENVDLYIPRKCSSTNRIIASKDHAAVQINLVELDNEGKATGSIKGYAICGEVRRMGESDDSINRLAKSHNLLSKQF
ncbi:putative 40S ribosomal protein S21 [Hypsibius exemplaris]|uniref:Small ribosomal subunit protein eS21 n=1 Tax=Hypsibius exemplaris TaxID=2072580 RepID=A0A1W0WHD7_HYPEX|nr:putative 40S ribosomal protein S21 [Hypsibius exemplaris]